jgi:hypothetical protein
MEYERGSRMEMVMSLLKDNDYVDQCFLVDKGHEDGREIHCVTSSGIIFVLNHEKYEAKRPCLVTILIARPSQVLRYYKGCGLWVDQSILDECIKHEKLGLNYV